MCTRILYLTGVRHRNKERGGTETPEKRDRRGFPRMNPGGVPVYHQNVSNFVDQLSYILVYTHSVQLHTLCVYMCVYMCVHTHMCIHVCTRVHMCVHVYAHVGAWL